MAEILGGLAVLGTAVANKLKNKDDKKNNKIKSTVSGNIYNSNKLPEVRKTMQQKADDRYELSKNPKKTGVIPKYYNRVKADDDNDSNFSDDESNHSVASEGKPLYEKAKDMINRNRVVEHFVDAPKQPQGKDTFLNQFAPMAFNNPRDPVAANKIAEQVGNISRLSLERDLSLKSGYSQCNDDMTYGVVPASEMTHNNMQPDFRPKKNYGFNIDEYKHLNDISQRKLDLFTGSLNSLEYRPKTERKPLFNPLIGLTNIYGAPVVTSEYESRFIPSRERRNEKPFQEVKVTPGLNLGYNEIGKQGYHDPYRAFDRPVNELRVGNKLKTTYTTPIIQGQKGARQPTVPVVPKRRPITFEEWGTKRMMPSFNTEIAAPTVYGEYNPTNMATVNRGKQERLTYGPAQYTYTISTPDSLYPLVLDSRKENFETDGPRNTTMVQAQQARGFNESWTPPMTQRMQSNEYIGPAFHQNSNKMYAYNTLDNVPDPTMRELHADADRYGAGMGQSQYYKHQAFDADNAVPDPTMRNLHEDVDRYGAGVGQSQYYKHQAFDADNAVPDPTMRNLHEDVDRYGAGMGQSQYHKHQAFDAFNAVPDPTMRNLHEDVDRYGAGVGQSQYHKPQAFDAFNAVPDPTMRNIHEDVDRYGVGMGHSQYNKPQAFDAFNAVPDPTMRNIHEDADRYGAGMGHSQYHKPQAFDKDNAVPDPTMRNIHEDADRYGAGMGHGQYHKPQAFDKANAVPDPTMRNIHEDADRYGNGLGFHERYRCREDAMNSQVNVEREVVAAGRAPTTCNFSKCPSIEGTIVQLCDNIQINRDIFPDITQQITPKMPTVYSRVAQRVPNDEWHFNSYVTDNLEGNPYINNTQHKSVPNKK